MFTEKIKSFVLIDFEFDTKPGELPNPLCMVAKNLQTGEERRLWTDELVSLGACPFPTDKATVYVAYYSSAEWNCFLKLGWPLPESVLDLYVEYKCLNNGKPRNGVGYGLLAALNEYQIESIGVAEKKAMRELVLRGGPYSESEKKALLDYCASDVYALEKLLPKILPAISLDHALLRGRYMKAVAHMEHIGVPIDLVSLGKIKENFENIKANLIERIDQEYGVYEGGSFRYERFAKYLAKNEISWPRLETGRLDLSTETFKDMSHSFPSLQSLQELRQTLSQLRLNKLEVGEDGRNRCLLSPFQSKTGRNQPSNSKHIFGGAKWTRGLIQAKHNWAVAYIDFAQQEFGIGAALSGDEKMIEAYQSGDPYLAFAKQAGAAPIDANKESHGKIREQYKSCVLAVQYGMGAQSLAFRIGQSTSVARQLLHLHRKTYPGFWKWSDGVVDHVMLTGCIQTTFGWKHSIDVGPNARSIRNFPMQANGAEILRLTCISATESGINVCAPIHDALLIEAPETEIEAAVLATQSIMAQASAVVLNGFILKSDAEIFRHPNRLLSHQSRKMWDTVWAIIDDFECCNPATSVLQRSNVDGSTAHTRSI